MTDADDDVDAWKEMAADNDEEEDVDFGAIVQQTQSLDDGSGALEVIDKVCAFADKMRSDNQRTELDERGMVKCNNMVTLHVILRARNENRAKGLPIGRESFRTARQNKNGSDRPNGLPVAKRRQIEALVATRRWRLFRAHSKPLERLRLHGLGEDAVVRLCERQRSRRGRDACAIRT